jgi:hypothetical protein
MKFEVMMIVYPLINVITFHDDLSHNPVMQAACILPALISTLTPAEYICSKCKIN